MTSRAPHRSRFARAVALAGSLLPLSGCVYTGLHSQTRIWADENTYGRPALVVEQIDHLPERRAFVERLRWQYGLGPGRVPVIEPAVAVDPFLGDMRATPVRVGPGVEMVEPHPIAPAPAPPPVPAEELPVLPMLPRALPPVAPPALVPPVAEPAVPEPTQDSAPPPPLGVPTLGERRDEKLRGVAGGWMFRATTVR